MPRPRVAAQRAREEDVARLEGLIAEAEREAPAVAAGMRVDAAIHRTGQT